MVQFPLMKVLELELELGGATISRPGPSGSDLENAPVLSDARGRALADAQRGLAQMNAGGTASNWAFCIASVFAIPQRA